MWLPREWLACWRALRAEKRLVRMTHGSLSPIYIEKQSKWKKRLVGPIERWLLRRADRVVVTCAAEAEWVRAYEPRAKKIELTDLKRFFNLDQSKSEVEVEQWNPKLHCTTTTPDYGLSSHTFILKMRKLDTAWNLVKVTRRGFGAVCELVKAEGRKPGFKLEVR